MPRDAGRPAVDGRLDSVGQRAAKRSRRQRPQPLGRLRQSEGRGRPLTCETTASSRARRRSGRPASGEAPPAGPAPAPSRPPSPPAAGSPSRPWCVGQSGPECDDVLGLRLAQVHRRADELPVVARRQPVDDLRRGVLDDAREDPDRDLLGHDQALAVGPDLGQKAGEQLDRLRRRTWALLGRSSRCASSMLSDGRAGPARRVAAASPEAAVLDQAHDHRSYQERPVLSSPTSSISSTTLRRSSAPRSRGWPPSKKRPVVPSRRRSFLHPARAQRQVPPELLTAADEGGGEHLRKGLLGVEGGQEQRPDTGRRASAGGSPPPAPAG